MNRKILILSAYDAESHRQWRRAIESMFPEYHWTHLTLPPRHFSWRVRGNSLYWGMQYRETLSQDYDLLIATSMVDLASLRGFIPKLSCIPTIVYFHENQFAYPENLQHRKSKQHSILDAQMVSLYSALCADYIVFNSKFNQTSLIIGVKELINRLPDCIPDGIIERLETSTILPVPLSDTLAAFSTGESPNLSESAAEPLRLVWNHRWEYDKGPDLLLEIIRRIIKQKLAINICILGQQFRRQPDEFAEISTILEKLDGKSPTVAGPVGYIASSQRYYSTLSGMDVVLSTAYQDFQGLSLLEACTLNCTPLAPDRLVYPEYLAEKYLYTGDDSIPVAEIAAQVVDKLELWMNCKASGKKLPKFDTEKFSASFLKNEYLALFNKSAGFGRKP